MGEFFVVPRYHERNKQSFHQFLFESREVGRNMEMNQYHVVTTHRLQHLPEAVRRYMNYTGVIGKPWIETVRLKQI